jgi:hypothetical protein
MRIRHLSAACALVPAVILSAATTAHSEDSNRIVIEDKSNDYTATDDATKAQRQLVDALRFDATATLDEFVTFKMKFEDVSRSADIQQVLMRGHALYRSEDGVSAGEGTISIYVNDNGTHRVIGGAAGAQPTCTGKDDITSSWSAKKDVMKARVPLDCLADGTYEIQHVHAESRLYDAADKPVGSDAVGVPLTYSMNEDGSWSVASGSGLTLVVRSS